MDWAGNYDYESDDHTEEIREVCNRSEIRQGLEHEPIVGVGRPLAISNGRRRSGDRFQAKNHSTRRDFQVDTVSGGRFSIFTNAGQRGLERSGLKKSLAPNHINGCTSPCAIAWANESAAASMSEQTK